VLQAGWQVFIEEYCSRTAPGHEAVVVYREWPATQRMRRDRFVDVRVARRVKLDESNSQSFLYGELYYSD
jgi:hypothetical protein